MSEPEFIIRIRSEPSPRPIQFGDIFPIKDELQSLTLLWDTNSYMANRDKRFIIINGGRKISFSEFKECRDLKIFYRQRVSQDIAVGNDIVKERAKRILYLLGFVGTVRGETKYVFLQIATDGTQWIWKDGK